MADRTAPVSDLPTLLRSMRPVFNPGTVAFAVAPPHTDLRPLAPLATFREAEGLTLILDADTADRAGLIVVFRAAWITLTVHSDLAAVGLTAAVSTALAHIGVSCNVVAAVHHDHLFVPVADAERAMACLAALQRGA